MKNTKQTLEAFGSNKCNCNCQPKGTSFNTGASERIYSGMNSAAPKKKGKK